MSSREKVEHRAKVVPVVGIVVTLAVHAGVLVAMWFVHHAPSTPHGPQLGAFVDAQLVKFGKPRDLTFLPHKEGVVKSTVQKADIKIARDANAPITPKEEKADVDPLKKTHAELFKNLPNDDRPPAVEETGGSLQGSRAGTATEAKGDPYLSSLIDKIGSAWNIPTTLREEQLKDLSSDVCLTIDGGGTLAKFEVIRKSGNSQFDSSLEAALGMIKSLPAPPDRFRSTAARGKLCPCLGTQGACK